MVVEVVQSVSLLVVHSRVSSTGNRLINSMHFCCSFLCSFAFQKGT